VRDTPPPRLSAATAGLRYLEDSAPGIRRRRAGSGFTYLTPTGARLRDRPTLARIRSLAVPPAWTDVWICPDPSGHLQATGRDQKGRKQYRYHPRFREVRERAKYDRLASFGRALSQIRRQVAEDLSRRGLSRRRVLAAVVRLLETTLIRVGNEEYARRNRSFGLTTLRSRHVEVSGSRLRFHFRGKSGKEHVVGIQDRRLSRLVARLQELPGQELFQWVDEHGRLRPVESADVNAYLRRLSGHDFTAKDFRTWAGTVRAAWALQRMGPPGSARQANRKILEAINGVARRLGNTPTICRKCYVHPEVLEAYGEGGLAQALARRSPSISRLYPLEVAVLAFLERRDQQGRRRTA
jgi:DNA topoisomerase I